VNQTDLFSCLAEDGYTVTRPADLPTPAERQTVWQTHAEQQADEASRLATAKDRVLARLREGPATNVVLNGICYRYGARIFELKQQGYGIERDLVSKGVWMYTLVSEPTA
jgi:hypothetical protein